jgi:hypothetical protein
MKYTAMPSMVPVMSTPNNNSGDNAVSSDEPMPSPDESSPGSYDEDNGNMGYDDQMSEPSVAPVVMPVEDRTGTESPSLSATISIGAPVVMPVEDRTPETESPSLSATISIGSSFTVSNFDSNFDSNFGSNFDSYYYFLPDQDSHSRSSGYARPNRLTNAFPNRGSH